MSCAGKKQASFSINGKTGATSRRWPGTFRFEFVQLFRRIFPLRRRGGAASVCSLDISEHALAAARRNFALNQDQPAVARCRHETIQADAFVWLRQNPEQCFDLIILDPPSLAKRESEKDDAMAAYAKLIEAASRV